jgi:hypothetical protein
MASFTTSHQHSLASKLNNSSLEIVERIFLLGWVLAAVKKD